MNSSNTDIELQGGQKVSQSPPPLLKKTSLISLQTQRVFLLPVPGQVLQK